ncbi:MAG: polysaccharide pyruvyl transferase family protein [Bacteriovorax sp.]
MKARPKILISGSYGTGNTGDEVILACILDYLKYYDVTVLSQEVEYTKKCFPQVKVIHQTPSWEIRRILKDLIFFNITQIKRRILFLNELRKADIFWLGGGGLLSEMIPRILRYYLHQLFFAKFFNCKVLLFAVGVGPLTTLKGKHFLKKIMDNVPLFISVRDQNSKALLLDAGVKREIKVVPDPAFLFKAGIEPVCKDQVIFNFYSMFNNESVWPGQQHRYENLKNAIIELTRYLTDDLNYKVIFLPFGTKWDAVFSNEMRAEFIDKFPNLADRVKVFEADNYKDIINTLVSAKWSISTRFHAGLIAMANGHPSICIDSQYKSERLLIEMNLPKLLVQLPDGHHKSGNKDLDLLEIKEKIRWLEENYDSTQKQIEMFINKSQSELSTFYKELDEILKSI